MNMQFTDNEKEFFKEVKAVTESPLVDTDGLEMMKTLMQMFKKYNMTVIGAGTNRFAVQVSGNYVVKIPFRDTGRKDNMIELSATKQVLQRSTEKKNRATLSLGMIGNSPSLLIQEKGLPLHYYMLMKEQGHIRNASEIDFHKYIQLAFEWLMENIDHYNAMILELYKGAGLILDDLTPEKVAQYCIKNCTDNQVRLATLDYGNCMLKPVKVITCPVCGEEILPAVIEKVADLRIEQNMFSQTYKCKCKGLRGAEAVYKIAVAQKQKMGSGGGYGGGLGDFQF